MRSREKVGRVRFSLGRSEYVRSVAKGHGRCSTPVEGWRFGPLAHVRKTSVRQGRLLVQTSKASGTGTEGANTPARIEFYA